jgi:peroxiredoxin Q/BCP
MALQIGEKAPEFTLEDQQGNSVHLSDCQGKWVVLYFYPKDNTPGCTTEACDFTQGLKDFEALNAVVLGCSPDSPDEHCKFIEDQGLGLTLLSDPDTQVMRQYGAYGEKTRNGETTEGVLRSTVLIDPDGKVAYHWPEVKPEGHAGEVRQKLQALVGGAA